MFYAHMRCDGEKQTIADHLIGTAERCRAFAAEFHAGEQGYLAGLCHDIGKYSNEFQQRLLNNGPRVDHSSAGAFECFRMKQPMIAFCVAGHHSGIPDMGGCTDNTDQSTFCGRMNRVKKHKVPDYSEWQNEIKLPDTPKPVSLIGEARGEDFYTRMIFSCLTDADYLDTEYFMSDGSVERNSGDSISHLAEKLDIYISNWDISKTEINIQRSKILRRCMNCGDDNSMGSGIFTLTVPTGSGKTIASLAFALHHARTYGKRRIIYVIPYTSIIEQTSDIFRSILGSENVLEHHSGVLFDSDEEATPESIDMLRATENWDKPIVVTTAVQFFDSIYSNRSSKCRKIHNIANSVIVFDEAQMIPLNHLRPCVSAITQLVGNFSASALLCTATQPALNNLVNEFLPEHIISELCPKNAYDDSVFNRVSFSVEGLIPWADIAERMRKASQILCIVNTRKGAKELYALLSDMDGVYHLSTLMVPEHRRKSLDEIRNRLKCGLPCRVVSTSLIEAGVDIDFPLVFRELAGLDSVLQAAGRCNREGKHPAQESIVTVFTSETRIPSLFERNTDVAKSVIGRHDNIASEEAIHDYFEMLLTVTGKDALDQKQVLSKIQTFSFSKIADDFHMIDNDTVTLYIPREKGVDLIERIKSGELSRSLFREAAQYSVSLYRNDLQKLINSGDICQMGNKGDLWYLSNMEKYNDTDGLSLESCSGQALFC